MSSASPITQSPSIGIVSLSNLTIADASDDESPIDTMNTDDPDDEGMVPIQSPVMMNNPVRMTPEVGPVGSSSSWTR
jgi:hypothetical protein